MNCAQVENKNQHPAGEQRARAVQYSSPAVDIHQNADGFALEIELPGVDKSGVDLTIEDGKLIIVGHRNRDSAAGKVLHREISGLDYRRVFDLDPVIDPSSVHASIDNGLLKIRLNKAEAHKPRKIEVS